MHGVPPLPGAAQSAGSQALATLSEELQRNEKVWRNAQEAFRRRAEGLSAELDDHQRVRASRLSGLHQQDDSGLLLNPRAAGGAARAGDGAAAGAPSECSQPSPVERRDT